MSTVWSLREQPEKDADGELVLVRRVRDRHLRFFSGYFDVIILDHTPRYARSFSRLLPSEDVVSERRRDVADCEKNLMPALCQQSVSVALVTDHPLSACS